MKPMSRTSILLSAKPLVDFLERQIGLLRNQVEQLLLVRLGQQAGMASAGFGFDATRRPLPEPMHCSRDPDVDQARDYPPALTLLSQRCRTLAQGIPVPLAMASLGRRR